MDITSDKQRLIPVDFSNPSNGKTIHCDALVDTGADITCISEKLAHDLELFDGPYSSKQVQTFTGEVSQIWTCFVDITVGENQIKSQEVLALKNYSGTALLGWDVLSDGSILSSISPIIFGQVIHLLNSVTAFKKNLVLVLGQDTTELHRLREIQTILERLGYQGLIVKDIADIEIQTVEEKVNMLSSLCRFVVCENSVPSGHIDELKICASNRFVTAIVQQEGMGATWMQSDYPFDYQFMKTFNYPSIDTIESKLLEVVDWAEERLEQKRVYLNNLYSWR